MAHINNLSVSGIGSLVGGRSRVSFLIAGDSNMKFVKKMFPNRSCPDVQPADVLCFPGARVMDDTTGLQNGLFKRLGEMHPDYLVLHLGSNDVASGFYPSTIVRCYQNFIDDIHQISRGTTVIVGSVLPRLWNWYKSQAWNEQQLPVLRDMIGEINSALKVMCEQPGICFVDYRNLDFVAEKHLGRDGLHVKPGGAEVLFRGMLSIIQERIFTLHCASTDQNTDVIDEWPQLVDDCFTPCLSGGKTYADIVKIKAGLNVCNDKKVKLENEKTKKPDRISQLRETSSRKFQWKPIQKKMLSQHVNVKMESDEGEWKTVTNHAVNTQYTRSDLERKGCGKTFSD